VGSPVEAATNGGDHAFQRFLVNRMIAPVPQDYRGRVIELGAGSGALTLRLAARCPQARILVCEINRSLAQVNRSNLAAAGVDSGRVEVVADSAETVLAQLCRKASDKPDFIISGIPLGISPPTRLWPSLTRFVKPCARAHVCSVPVFPG